MATLLAISDNMQAMLDQYARIHPSSIKGSNPVKLHESLVSTINQFQEVYDLIQTIISKMESNSLSDLNPLKETL
jgi:hypothetical protein